MYTGIALTARRFALTLAVAGIAGLGSIAVAPAASAADLDGPRSVVQKSGGNGPDAFIVSDHGVRAVFFCNPAKPMKQHNTCTVPVTSTSRF